MHKDKDILYIFLHIPKTAGNTFCFHIKRNFKKEEIMELYGWDFYPLDSRYVLKGKSKKNADKYISSLTKKEKDKIKVIYGHLAYYGVHDHFNKPYRYITFMRNPINGTISWYNFLFTIFEQKKEFRKANFLINKKTPSLKEWLQKVYKADKKLTLVHELLPFIECNDYIDNNSKENIIKQFLSKFYFIGITENFAEDSLYLYHLLGINKFYSNKNISKKYVKMEDLDRETKDLLIEKNKEDIELYNHALDLSRKFKQDHPEFYPIVRKTKIKRILILPFTQIMSFISLQTIYNVSFWIKKYSRTYRNFILYIKKI